MQDSAFEERRAKWRGRYRKLNHANPDDLVGSPGRLLTLAEAAGYLGVSYSSMGIWARQGKINTVYLGKRRPRFQLSDLDEMIMNHKAYRRVWDVHSKELPLTVVARLLNKKKDSEVSWMAFSGRLRNYTEASVREYMRRQMKPEVKREVHAYYKKKIRKMVDMVRYRNLAIKKLTESLQRATCQTCHCRILNPEVRPPKI